MPESEYMALHRLERNDVFEIRFGDGEWMQAVAADLSPSERSGWA
jgi:hypothetical protein